MTLSSLGKKVAIIGLILIVLVLLASWIVGSYNTLVYKDELVKQGWSQVENQYQRRADLVPNLVATVKGYAAHESSTLQEVVEARAKATNTNVKVDDLSPESMQRFAAAQGELSQALGRLMVVIEKYPDLKANEQFLTLQAQLEGTENRISVERKRFNENVNAFNSYRRKFPKNIVASIFGFAEKAYFEAEAGSDVAPKVEF